MMIYQRSIINHPWSYMYIHIMITRWYLYTPSIFFVDPTSGDALGSCGKDQRRERRSVTWSTGLVRAKLGRTPRVGGLWKASELSVDLAPKHPKDSQSIFPTATIGCQPLFHQIVSDRSLSPCELWQILGDRVGHFRAKNDLGEPCVAQECHQEDMGLKGIQLGWNGNWGMK